LEGGYFSKNLLYVGFDGVRNENIEKKCINIVYNWVVLAGICVIASRTGTFEKYNEMLNKTQSCLEGGHFSKNLLYVGFDCVTNENIENIIDGRSVKTKNSVEIRTTGS